MTNAAYDLSDADKKRLLEEVQTIAVVGLSPKSDRPSHRVAKAMQKFSYKIVPVRPAVDSILGEQVYNSLLDVPFKVDLVNVFRASKHVPPIVEQCIETGVRAIWLQEGITHELAAQSAINAGISFIMDQCIYKEFIRLGLNNNDVEQ